jgi:hypothetical protein
MSSRLVGASQVDDGRVTVLAEHFERSRIRLAGRGHGDVRIDLTGLDDTREVELANIRRPLREGGKRRCQAKGGYERQQDAAIHRNTLQDLNRRVSLVNLSRRPAP